MRALRLASAVAVSAVLVGGLTACGSDGKPDVKAAGDAAAKVAGDLDPKAALAASAAVMKKAGNGTILLESDGDKTNGTADWSGKSTALDVTVQETGPNRFRVLGDKLYVGVGPELKPVLGGKTWTQLDPKDPAAAAMSGLYTTTAQMVNPVVQLTAGAAIGKPTKVGAEKVDGVDTTHYRATEEVAALVAAFDTLGPEQRAAVQKTLAQDGQTLTVDFWINAKQELVQFKESGDKTGEKGGVTIKYSGLGAAPKIEAPAPAELGPSMNLKDLLGS